MRTPTTLSLVMFALAIGVAGPTRAEEATPPTTESTCTDRAALLAKIAGETTDNGPSLRGQSSSEWKKIDKKQWSTGQLAGVLAGAYDDSTATFVKLNEKSHLDYDNKSKSIHRLGIAMGVQVSVRNKNASGSVSLPSLGKVFEAGTSNFEITARFIYKGAQSTALDQMQASFKWNPSADGMSHLEQLVEKAWLEIHKCDTRVWAAYLGNAPCVTPEDREYAAAVIFTLQHLAAGSTLEEALVDVNERKKRPYGLVVKEVYLSFGVDESRHQEPIPESVRAKAREELAPWGLLSTQCKRST